MQCQILHYQQLYSQANVRSLYKKDISQICTIFKLYMFILNNHLAVLKKFSSASGVLVFFQ